MTWMIAFYWAGRIDYPLGDNCMAGSVWRRQERRITFALGYHVILDSQKERDRKKAVKRPSAVVFWFIMTCPILITRDPLIFIEDFFALNLNLFSFPVALLFNITSSICRIIPYVWTSTFKSNIQAALGKSLEITEKTYG